MAHYSLPSPKWIHLERRIHSLLKRVGLARSRREPRRLPEGTYDCLETQPYCLLDAPSHPRYGSYFARQADLTYSHRILH